MTTLILAGLVAFLSCVLFTPLVRRLATRYQLVDRPDPERKLHGRVVSLGGGIAILLATLIAVSAVAFIPDRIGVELLERGTEWVGFLLACLVIAGVGLVDDRWGLRGRQKLAGQFAAVAILVSSGLVIRNVRIFEWDLDLGLLAIPFTLFWLLGAINAMNLIDGADGMATTVGLIISGTLALMAALCGHPVEAAVAAAVAGALLGFLLFNFPPASIFLGDAGSMLIGLAVGALAVRSALKGPATVALAAPLALMAIPVFDSAIAILRRKLTGRGVFTTDRGHLHHSLLRRGFTPRGMLFCIAILCGATAAGALVSISLKNELFALLTAGAVIGSLIAGRIFGHAEMLLLTNRLLAFGGSLVTASSVPHGTIRQETVRLQGSRNWDELWNTLTDFAERHELSNVRLELNMAWLHEGYHASWARAGRCEPADVWHTKLPMIVNGRTLGRLEIAGPLNDSSIHVLLSLMAEMLESLEPCLLRLTKELPQDPLQQQLAANGFPHDLPNEIQELSIETSSSRG